MALRMMPYCIKKFRHCLWHVKSKPSDSMDFSDSPTLRTLDSCIPACYCSSGQIPNYSFYGIFLLWRNSCQCVPGMHEVHIIGTAVFNNNKTLWNCEGKFQILNFGSILLDLVVNELYCRGSERHNVEWWDRSSELEISNKIFVNYSKRGSLHWRHTQNDIF